MSETAVSLRTWRHTRAAWKRAIIDDVRGSRRLFFGAVVGLLGAAVAIAYYASNPGIDLDPDTPGYLGLAHALAHSGFVVDRGRLPGYPLFILAVFTAAGKHNLAALAAAQAALFILATIELYILTLLIVRRAWIACLVSLLAGTNVIILSYVKVILSEALTLFLVVSLALAVVVFLRNRRPRNLWIVTAVCLALFLTRPEWIYMPLPLLGYLLLIAWRRGELRRYLPHALAGVAVLYSVLGLYIAMNGAQNGYYGVTDIQNINLLGKVMQYHMQNEAPPQYSDVAKLVNSYVSRGDLDPWDVIFKSNYQPIERNAYSLAAHYSTAIILSHPLEYLGDSIALGWQSFQMTDPFHPFPSVLWLTLLGAFSTLVLHSLIAFPFLAVFWWVLLFRRRLRGSVTVEMMGGVALLGFYGLAITTLGGYVYFPRLHTPFDPLLIVVVWNSLALGLLHLAGRLRRTRGTEPPSLPQTR